MQPDVELPGPTEIPQTPSPGFAIKEKRAANINWIKDYKLPESFSPRVHKDLMDGKLSGNHRDEFTRDVVSSIKVHTMYPTAEEKQKVASLIIQKYPFLADSIGAGTGSWCKAITNRFKNLRRKKACGETPACKQIKPIGTPKSEPSTKKRKLVDFPHLPEGETQETCTEHKKVLVKEMAKSRRNLPLIRELMELTYSHHRHNFLKQPKTVVAILEEYPALHLISEVKVEFGRILGEAKLIREMVNNFKSLEESIIQYASRCTKRSIKTLENMMKGALEEDPHKESDIRSTVVALMIQDILKEKAGELLFLKVCCDDESIDEETEKSTYPRLIGSGDLANVETLFIAAEGQRFLDFSNLGSDRIPTARKIMSLFPTVSD
ncbi:Hypothetical predicted protein [Paramuricea clavata]|uniref:Uncharacterized protein n=1 Tax=Paramuricea clavata TaxID=317549 RepID=A0A6S7GSM3_PARCT|nr:Hypothetical predicted protein [Paramuricea clavata]